MGIERYAVLFHYWQPIWQCSLVRNKLMTSVFAFDVLKSDIHASTLISF